MPDTDQWADQPAGPGHPDVDTPGVFWAVGGQAAEVERCQAEKDQAILDDPTTLEVERNPFPTPICVI